MRKIKVGVIGVGTIGTAHASCIYNGEIEEMELCALCDNDKARIEELKTEFVGIPLFENSAELIKSGLVEAVIIATPHYLHPEISAFALKNNCHTMCEKPIAVYTLAAAEPIKAKEEGKSTFAIMFNQRANKLFKMAREMVLSGEIGEILENVWIITNWYRTQEYYDSSSWRGTWQGEGGGVLMNQAPHNLDLWQWICGMPKRIKSICYEGKHHNIEVEDEAIIYAEYENGANGVFITSTGHKYGTNRFEITGTKGKIVLEKGTLTCETDKGATVISDEDYNGHKELLINFARSVLNKEELIAKGEEGLNQLMLCNGAYLSSWKGGEWIDLPFDEGEYLNLLKSKVEKSVPKSQESKKNLFGKSYKDKWKTNW